jgi:large subunit ribosomal protein L35
VLYFVFIRSRILPNEAIHLGIIYILFGVNKCQKLKQIAAQLSALKRTGGGGFKCAHSHLRHILTKKSTKRKRQLRSPAAVHPSDLRMVNRMMPYV